jgi:hypothetical protein
LAQSSSADWFIVFGFFVKRRQNANLTNTAPGFLIRLDYCPPVPKAGISLTRAGAPADTTAELPCHSSEQPRRSYFAERHNNARLKKMSGYVYGKINRCLVGASLQFSLLIA